MTDVVTDREVPGETGQIAVVDVPGVPPAQELAWAPAEPPRKRRHLGLWIGIPLGVLALGVAAASVILIAPGVKISGVDVGFMTPGAAADAVEQHLAATTVTLSGDAEATLSGADLGATVDARHLVNEAFAQHPLWNVTAWFPAPVEAEVALDETAATAALRAALPDLYSDPIPARIDLDEKTTTFEVTPAVDGHGIDVATVRTALQEALAAGATQTRIPAAAADIPALTTTAAADTLAEQLNKMVREAGYYVGSERTVPLDAPMVASWLEISTDDATGEFEVDVDPADVQPTVKALKKQVEREAVDATVITDPDGNVLREETAGQTGRALTATTGIAAAFAAQLGQGNGIFELSVEETPFTTTTLARSLEVNLSTQTTYLIENGKVVQSWLISSGLPGTPTPTGNFSVFAHVAMQDMGCYEGATYCTTDVPFVTYFAPDVGFHGAYWHNNFGNQMSHGCVNMPIWQAEYVYNWAPTGTPVWVHY